MNKVKNFKVICKYDSHYDMLGIKIIEKYEYYKSVEVKSGVILDFDTNDNPVALQLIGASQIFGVSKESLENILSIDMKVKINELGIYLDLILWVGAEEQIFTSFISNDAGFPSIEAELMTG